MSVAKFLAISPHLDDAVLSYGGRLASLAANGHEVVVYTVFAGTPTPPYSPVAAGFHAQWEAVEDPVAPRRDEDCSALAAIGAIPLHGTYLDAVYRRNDRGEWLIQTGKPTEYLGDEPGLLADVAATIAELAEEHRPQRLLTCAGMGAHVDHRHARDAVLLAASRTGIEVAAWDDFPYVTWTEAIPPLPAAWELSEAAAEPVEPAHWAAKNKAVRCYASQLAMLEEDGTPLHEWYMEHCDSRAARYGVSGPYEVARRVVPSAAH